MATNRPRNLLVTDATGPYTFTYMQYGKRENVTVQQTASEETWPGGALWDIGVLLSHVFVGLASGKTVAKVDLPSRLLDAFPSCKDLTVLELGCGVGLTGLVAAAALGTKLTILTDLKVVVEDVTIPNVLSNTVPTTGKHPYRLTKAGKRGRVLAMPLCWGELPDAKLVEETLISCVPPPKTPRKQKGVQTQTKDMGKPDIILIGDVAYQHKPGAPSHFEALLATVVKFLGPETHVLFGTRMRMPASADLLQLFLEHMEEAVSPPISADEIDPSFGKFKHQISVHVLRKRRCQGLQKATIS